MTMKKLGAFETPAQVAEVYQQAIIGSPSKRARATSVRELSLEPVTANAASCWYAVYTLPQSEKSVSAHLAFREVESYLPTYETVRRWRNRQRVRLQLPLFPSYLFVRIGPGERGRVLAAPGVVRIVGNSRDPIPIADKIIEFLRSDLCSGRAEPYPELVVGERVRIKDGPMRGVEGTLVRKDDNLRFVLSVEMIQRDVAIKIDGSYVEPIPDPQATALQRARCS